MFEKRRAISIYKQLLKDLEEVKRVMENSEKYDGFDRGYAIVSRKYVNDKLNHYLQELAAKDGYNFNVHDTMNVVDGSKSTMYIIDNESEEFKRKREEEIIAQVKTISQKERKKVVNLDSSKNKSKVIKLDDYKRKLK